MPLGLAMLLAIPPAHRRAASGINECHVGRKGGKSDQFVSGERGGGFVLVDARAAQLTFYKHTRPSHRG